MLPSLLAREVQTGLKQFLTVGFELAPRPPVDALQWAVGLGAKQGHFPARTLTTDLRERCRGASAGKSP